MIHIMQVSRATKTDTVAMSNLSKLYLYMKYEDC